MKRVMVLPNGALVQIEVTTVRGRPDQHKASAVQGRYTTPEEAQKGGIPKTTINVQGTVYTVTGSEQAAAKKVADANSATLLQ